jgi:hypothetical protein
MEYAKFLQETAKEMARELQTSRSGEMKQTAEDLDEFLNKVFAQIFLLTRKHRSTGVLYLSCLVMPS